VTVVAQAELELDRPVEQVFAALLDYRTWPHWMPKAFAPVRGPSRELRAGDRVTVRMNGALITRLSVLRVRPNKEISWRGGLPGLLVGEHSFFFDDLGQGRTRVRSHEPFTGLLTKLPPVGKTLKRDAGAVGLQMLENLRDYVTRSRRTA
jgi:hypothetical protein